MPQKRRRRSRHRFDRIPNVPASGFSGIGNAAARRTEIETMPLGPDPRPLSPLEVIDDTTVVNIVEDDSSGDSYYRTHSHYALFEEGDSFLGRSPTVENTNSVQGNRTDVREQFMGRASPWRVLWALILTCGSRKLTKDQYQSVR